MIDGKVTEFIDNLTIQDEMVRYEGNLYYFYGIRFDEKRNYIIQVLINFATI